MSKNISRRDAVKQLAASSASLMAFAGVIRGAEDIVVAGQPVEIAVWSLSRSTVRITVRPITVGSPPAIVNAVCDALAPYGVRHVDMPCTPSRVWDAMRTGGARP